MRSIGHTIARVLVTALLGLLVTAGDEARAEEGLVAHWTFDEGDGQVARDLTGNGHDAQLDGPEWVGSPRGHALRFDGVDDIVTYADVDGMNLVGDISLMVWIKTPASDAPTTNRLIFGDSGAGVQRNLNLRLSCYGQLMFEWADGKRNAYLTADANLLDGAWRHVTVVCDSGAMHAVLYVDGEPVSQTRMPLPISKAPTRGRMSGMWAGGCPKGDLDDIRLYNRALSPDEVRDAFQSQATVQIGRSRMCLEVSDDGPRSAIYTSLRNWTDQPRQARVERRVIGPDGAEQVTGDTVALEPQGSADVLLGHADLEPLFSRRTDLYLVEPRTQGGGITVSVDHGGVVDTQESGATSRAYLEAIRLQVENPWRRRMAPGKTPEVAMRVHMAIVQSLRAAGRLSVALTSRASGEVVARRTIKAPEPETRVTFDADDIPWGAYDVRAAFVDREGRELAATTGLATVLPGGEQRIEIVNNLCSELMNAAERGLLGRREIEFMNPRDGWCFFALEGRAALRLDDSEETLLRARGEGTVEAMRLLPAGRHTLRAGGQPTQIIVRAIPALVHNVYPTSPRITPFGPHTWERLSAWTLPNCNMIESHKPDIPEAHEWVGRGRSWIMNRTAPGLRGEGSPTAEEMLQYWRETPGWGTETMSGIQVDEYGPGFGNDKLLATARSAAMLAEAPEFAGRQWIPFVVRLYGTDVCDLFMKTTMAAGWPFSIERYVGEMPTAAEDRAHIETSLVSVAEGWEGALPGSLRHAIFTLMYAYLPYCTANRCPTADFRVHLEMQMQVLATHPAYFGLWGVQPYRANYVDEEILNCMGALLRHYCVEGRTELLLEDPYELAHVRNPDFEEGTAHWELSPAEEGSITTGEFAGYGTLQGRYPWTSYGETFLVMKRSAAQPNAFSQEIANLQAGRLYSLKMITADRQDLLAGESREAPCAVTMGVEGAEVLEGTFVHPFDSARGPKPFTRQHPFHMSYHYLQFRATGDTARLTVTDWQSDTEGGAVAAGTERLRAAAGGPIGQETVFSFIEIQPVFEG